MRQWVCDVILVVCCVFFGLVCVLTGIAIGQAITGPVESPPTTHVACFEDEPCWDCATMGNQVCGTVTTAP